MLERTKLCLKCDRPLPADAHSSTHYCDVCMPPAKRECQREYKRREKERRTALCLADLAILDRTQCRHCGQPLAEPAPMPHEIPNKQERMKWFCDSRCYRVFRDDGRVF